MLLKILDCCDTLSLQVHPPAEIAASMGGEPKTEMWFVAHADAGARLYAGLRKGVTRAAFEQALADGSVAECVHSVVPHRREFMFVESGRLHALGAGLLVYEIQQNSDTTYRVFDWNRVGLDGQPRALHVEESLRCIDFEDFEPAMQAPQADGEMVRCDYFATRSTVLQAAAEHELALPGEFVCLAVTQGTVEVAGTVLRVGDFILLPAAMERGRKVVRAVVDAEFLEIRLP
jgi:mannose-6-phosphate isomerase